MEAVKYLLCLQQYGKKSFEWWTDDALCQAHTSLYLKVTPPYGRVGVWIVCPPDKWFKVADLVKFLNGCRRSMGNDAAVLDASIVSDHQMQQFLFWTEEARFWVECELILNKWERFRMKTAKIIGLK